MKYAGYIVSGSVEKITPEPYHSIIYKNHSFILPSMYKVVALEDSSVIKFMHPVLKVDHNGKHDMSFSSIPLRDTMVRKITHSTKTLATEVVIVTFFFKLKL
jgi:hypothetical protein